MAFVEQLGVMDFSARNFDVAEDPDLEFAGANRPALTTELLARCVGGNSARWRSRSVGGRIAALLRFLRAQFRQRQFRVSRELRASRVR
jgi:hypothetical protein